MSFGERIKKLRVMRNLTMKELGVAVGFSEATADVRISQYESNTRMPKESMIKKLAKALNVNHKFLVAFSDNPLDEIPYHLLNLEIDNSVDIIKKERCNNSKIPEYYLSDKKLGAFLEEWYNIKQRLMNNIITLEEYNEWKRNWGEKNEGSN